MEEVCKEGTLLAALPGVKEKLRLSYGWWMVLVMDLVAIVSGGVWTYGFGAFILPLSDEFGWTRAELSLGLSLSRQEGSMAAPLGGYLTDRFGPRKVMLVGLSMFASGFIAFSFIHSLTAFYVVLFFMAIGNGLGFFMPMVTTVANWFKRKASVAMGVLQAGYGASGVVIPILVWLIYAHGWRTASVVVGMGLVVICLPAILLIRRRPEDCGYLPDCDERITDLNRTEQVDLSRAAVAPVEEGEFTMRQTMASRSYWYITIAHGVAGFSYTAMTIHTIPYLVSIGISTEIAAVALTAMTIISTVGRLGFGWLGDMFQKRHVMAACFALQMLGTMAFAGTQGLWLLTVSIITFAIGNGGQMPIRVAIQREYYGRTAFGSAQGVMQLVSAVISSLGATFAGWVFDQTGSYRPAFWMLSFVYVIAIALIMGARPPKVTAG